ncbi:hypothetical protein QE152_g38866 [Popillia japonica]|uniref:Uncharacterized protein n=1 Tax=Popillia japonica TaxID=7064 RepID=A0AAW1HW74_POPJA
MSAHKNEKRPQIFGNPICSGKRRPVQPPLSDYLLRLPLPRSDVGVVLPCKTRHKITALSHYAIKQRPRYVSIIAFRILHPLLFSSPCSTRKETLKDTAAKDEVV